jgi:hypothetical protein
MSALLFLRIITYTCDRTIIGACSSKAADFQAAESGAGAFVFAAEAKLKSDFLSTCPVHYQQALEDKNSIALSDKISTGRMRDSVVPAACCACELPSAEALGHSRLSSMHM